MPKPDHHFDPDFSSGVQTRYSFEAHISVTKQGPFGSATNYDNDPVTFTMLPERGRDADPGTLIHQALMGRMVNKHLQNSCGDIIGQLIAAGGKQNCMLLPDNQGSVSIAGNNPTDWGCPVFRLRFVCGQTTARVTVRLQAPLGQLPWPVRDLCSYCTSIAQSSVAGMYKAAKAEHLKSAEYSEQELAGFAPKMERGFHPLVTPLAAPTTNPTQPTKTMNNTEPSLNHLIALVDDDLTTVQVAFIEGNQFSESSKNLLLAGGKLSVPTYTYKVRKEHAAKLAFNSLVIVPTRKGFSVATVVQVDAEPVIDLDRPDIEYRWVVGSVDADVAAFVEAEKRDAILIDALKNTREQEAKKTARERILAGLTPGMKALLTGGSSSKQLGVEGQ